MQPEYERGAVYFMRSPAALWRNIGDEVALARPETEEFDVLSPTAAAAWRRLETPRTLPELTDRLANDYQASITSIAPDVEALVEDLVERGVIETVADGDD